MFIYFSTFLPHGFFCIRPKTKNFYKMLHTPKTNADKNILLTSWMYLVIFRTFALANKKNQFTITTNETRLFFISGISVICCYSFFFFIICKGSGKENALKAKYSFEIHIGRMNGPGCSVHPLFFTRQQYSDNKKQILFHFFFGPKCVKQNPWQHFK